MAEFVEKRREDMIPELEQMERIKLFDKKEISGIAKKRKEYEYKLQRHEKHKEDYLRYIQYEMDLLKLVKQRRDKFGITQKKSDIDFSIAKRVNHLYKEAINRFQDDLRFLIAYMKFCKHVKFDNCVSQMLKSKYQAHGDKPKFWHIAARWEIEETKDRKSALYFLLNGLKFHPTSQLLYKDAFRFLLEDAAGNSKNVEKKEEPSADKNEEMPIRLQYPRIIYDQAFKEIKDIKFIVELLNITKEFENTEKLQNQIVSDIVREYTHEPLMWDTMARRELEGLSEPFAFETPMEVDNAEQSTLRDRLKCCNKVYQTAVKKIKTEEMWSYYIDCMIEINQDPTSLPNFKKKLLKNALLQAQQAKMLKEKYYLHWIGMLKHDKNDENSQKKLLEILETATDDLPESVNLWQAKLRYLLNLEQEDAMDAEFSKASKLLGEKALPLWRMRLLHTQIKNPEKTEEIFKAALQGDPKVARDMKPSYVEWLVLTKGIQAARNVYNKFCLQPPMSLELHKKMMEMEVVQPEISVKNARKPHEMATLQFGKSNSEVWIDYINFEMKYGDPKKVPELHSRAVKTLEPVFTDAFISQYSLIKANLTQ